MLKGALPYPNTYRGVAPLRRPAASLRASFLSRMAARLRNSVPGPGQSVFFGHTLWNMQASAQAGAIDKTISLHVGACLQLLGGRLQSRPHGDTPPEAGKPVAPKGRPDSVWSCPWTSCPEPQTGRTSCPAKKHAVRTLSFARKGVNIVFILGYAQTDITVPAVTLHRLPRPWKKILIYELTLKKLQPRHQLAAWAWFGGLFCR